MFEHPITHHGITRQQTQRDHAMRLTAPHGLGEQKHRGTRALTPEMAKGPIHQREHSVGEIVLLEELSAVDLSLEECIEVEDRGAAIHRIDRRTGCAE